MTRAERVGLSVLQRLDPETAHTLALKALRLGLGPSHPSKTAPRLAVSLAGLGLPNPLGLAAGLDKNAVAVDALLRTGIGFLEVGAATPEPQPGNPKPRLFRLPADNAVINRFGFNNDGMEAIAARLAARTEAGAVGINLGANKTSTDRAGDYARVLERIGPHVAFATVNVSSPNTERLRELQGREALTALIDGVMETNDKLPRRLPIFLKIAPDLAPAELEDIAEVAITHGLAGLIATNTTVSRAGLTDAHREETGGLSGAPLFARSTAVLARLYELTGGSVPLIGVGGIGSAQDAYTKIRAGATALQIYSALVFKGFSLVAQILDGLEQRLAADGYARVADAVGRDAAEWSARLN
ncbi:MAG: quinone-dependent dihydroorotate dehydrogenase [Pseudomonadota bacterium]